MNAARTTPHRRTRHLSSRPAAFVPALAALILVVFVATPDAQQAPAFTASGSGASEINTALATDIDLLVGRSTVLNVGSQITRVSLTVPDVADAMVTAPGQLLIHGKTPGVISLFVWDKAGAIKTYEVNVRRDLSQLGEQLRALFPGEPIVATGNGKDVVLSGTVSSKYVVEKAADVAGGYVEKKEDVVNLLKQQEGVASNQVMLRVRFAEVSRSALQELGASLFTGPGGFHDYVARSTTQQFPAPNYEELSRGSIQGENNWGGGRDTVVETGGKSTFSDFLNLFIFNNKYNVGTVIKALSDKGLFQSLAEPNLISTNGKEASFLAGGEYPYPIVQPSSGGNSVTIQFKEYGIRLNFTPTVLGGDLINLKVRPEVSALDFSNAVVLEGFRIPALSTRRTETEVELQDGQTFAIAGLLNNTVTDSMRKIPGIGDIPILGWLFKSKAMQKNQTELVVIITPSIVRRGESGVSQGLPSLVQPYLGAPDKTYSNPDPWIGSPKYPATRPGGDQMPEPQAQAQPADGQPVASQPIADNAPLMARGEVTPVTAPAVPAMPVSQSMKSVPAGAVPPSQLALPADVKAQAVAQHRQVERAREQERKAAEMEARERAAAEQRQAAEEAAARQRAEEEQAAADKKAAEAEAQARKKAEADQRQADRLARERAEREAEVARRNQEAARKQAEQDARRDKSLSDAAARLKQAQVEYEQELQKSRGGADDVSKQASKGGEAPAAR
jgi:pilus assembly protein CpaC